ncbi:MAG: class I SAM-dependent methyltransferase [Candidatus Auribacterota bacterium]
MLRKVICVFFLVFTINLNVFSAPQSAGPILEKLAYRIAGRAEVIRDRVLMFHEDPSSQIPNLYYFIQSVLEDANGLYLLGDSEQARLKMVLLDTLTYDIVCAGQTSALSLNQMTGVMQQSRKASDLNEFKKITQQAIAMMSHRGLLESVHFNTTEEEYFSEIVRYIHSVAGKLPQSLSENDIREIVGGTGIMNTDNIHFFLPQLETRAEGGYLVGYGFDKQWGLTPILYFENKNVGKTIFLLALWNLKAFNEGMGINHNDTLESQIHHVLLQMRIADYLVKNADVLDLQDISVAEEVREHYRVVYEKLVEESFVPQYYDYLFALKKTASSERVLFPWGAHSTRSSAVNAPETDDYVFYLIGNGSQMPPNPRLVKLMAEQGKSLPQGTAFDLGCGDGSDALFLARNNDIFKGVVAVDHSQAVINRIRRLEYLEPEIAKLYPAKSDIRTYPYPDSSTPVHNRPNLVVLDNVVEFLPKQDRLDLFKKLDKALLTGGVLFIEYHIAEGETFQKLESDENITMDNDNTISSFQPFVGKQMKHFFKRDELQEELKEAGINEENGYVVSSEYIPVDNDFHFGVIVALKKEQSPEKQQAAQ